jgi:hypothetical protein
MDLHDGHLGALRIDALVEGEQPRLASLDEVKRALAPDGAPTRRRPA